VRFIGWKGRHILVAAESWVDRKMDRKRRDSRGGTRLGRLEEERFMVDLFTFSYFCRRLCCVLAVGWLRLLLLVLVGVGVGLCKKGVGPG